MIYDTFFSLDTNPSLEFTFFSFCSFVVKEKGRLELVCPLGKRGSILSSIRVMDRCSPGHLTLMMRMMLMVMMTTMMTKGSTTSPPSE